MSHAVSSAKSILLKCFRLRNSILSHAFPAIRGSVAPIRIFHREFHSCQYSYLMASIVKCPAFAESISEGDITWQKAVGDSVVEDEVVAEIETAKTSLSVKAPSAGVITKLLVEDGVTVIAGQELFVIDETATPADTAPRPTEQQTDVKHQTDPEKTETKEPTSVKEREKSVPERETASEWKTKTIESPSDLDELKVVESSDLDGTMQRKEHRVKMSRMRQHIAQRLKDAQNTCAMLTTFNEVDMSNVLQLRTKYKDSFLEKYGVKLGFMSAFVKASATSLTAMPVVNAYIDENEIVYRDYVDISIAVATPKGLVVPVIRNVEKMNFGDIEVGIGELGEKARKGLLTTEDMDGGTFTVSNGGVFGSLFGTPIINPPQSAILGLHGIFQRPVVVDSKTNAIEARPMMYIALTYDHRLIDGREAVTFLRKLKSLVEDPRLLLLGL